MMEESKQLFQPIKVIVMSELTIRDKELYYQMMIQNNSKFHKTEDGRFVTNIRLLAPSIKKSEFDIKKKDTSNYSIIFQNRLAKLKHDGFITVSFIMDNKEAFDYSGFPRFISLIANNGDILKPKQRPLAWCMRIIEDIYDYRFSYEKHDVEREDESSSFDLMLLIFPIFVVRRLGTNCGLKSIVDQTCVDLLYNAHTFRKECLELEVFSRFLQEFYDHDDLLFFLYVRSIIAKVMRISFKLRWTKNNGPGNHIKPLWLSYREASHVAKIVFGSDNEDVYRDFMRLIIPQMLGERTNSGDNRHIEVTSFLHLSVVGYHQSQVQIMVDEFGNPKQRMLVPIPGQLLPTIPVPIPEGFISISAGNNSIDEDEYYVYRQQQEQELLLQQQQQQPYDQPYDQQEHQQYQYESKESYPQIESEYGDNRDLDDNYLHEQEEYNPNSYNNYHTNNNNEPTIQGQNINNGSDYYGFQNITASPIYDTNNTIINYDIHQHQHPRSNQAIILTSPTSYHPLEDELEVPYERDDELSIAHTSPAMAMKTNSVLPTTNKYKKDDKNDQYITKKSIPDKIVTFTNKQDDEEVVEEQTMETPQVVVQNTNKIDYDNDRQHKLLMQQEELLQQQKLQQYQQDIQQEKQVLVKQHEQVRKEEKEEDMTYEHQQKQIDHINNNNNNKNMEDNNNEDDNDSYDDPANECAMLIAHRQQEFLFALIEPLQHAQIPKEYMEYITLDLSDRINQTIDIYLDDKPIDDDLEVLDSYLREFLELDAFIEDMEALRDEIVDYYMTDDANPTEQ